VSFNVPYRDHFRITNLPDAATLRTVFARIDELLAAGAHARSMGAQVIEAQGRFK
jgi:alanine-synthesizing transaminase